MATLTSPTESVAATKQHVIEPEGTKFRGQFNEKAFLFSHNLKGNPLFNLDRLTKLAEFLIRKEGANCVRWKNADSPVDAKWDQRPPDEQLANVSEAIQNLDKSGSWVVLYRVQNDPEYSAILEQALDDIEEMIGHPLRPEVTWKDSYIFMASPQALTPYHIDHETAFLMQVHGDRKAYLWDQKDRAIVTESELENYYMGDLGAGTYKEDQKDKATEFAMDAGKGVHHPVWAPHYYKNGDDYSIACGVHLCLRETDQIGRAYQVNSMLRKLGLKPTPVGVNPDKDQKKVRFMNRFDKKNPTNKYDLIRSGAAKFRKPLKLVSKITGR